MVVAVSVEPCLIECIGCLGVEEVVGLGERFDDELRSAVLAKKLTWWSSSCGRPETTMAPMGATSQLCIQMGKAGVSFSSWVCQTAGAAMFTGRLVTHLRHGTRTRGSGGPSPRASGPWRQSRVPCASSRR